ncbi:MAG: AsmA family protein [Tabrizicola sp.]
MRWIIRIGAGLAVLVLLALGLMAMVPSERVAAALSAQFEGMTGRKLVLEGEIRPRLWPVLGVTTGPVSIANADWAEGAAPLFRAESLAVEVNLSALLGGEVRITGLVAERPEINLERAPDGRENWVFGAGEAAGAGAVPAPATGFTLDRGTVRNGSLRFADRQSGRVVALDDVDAVLNVPDYAGPFTLTLRALSGGQAVGLDLKGGVFSAFAAGRVVPVTLGLTAGTTRIGFEGRAGLAPLAADGALTANLADLPALGQLIGSDLYRPGPGLGQDRLTVTGQLTLDGTGAAFLRQAEIVADRNRITGDLDLRPGEARPKLSGTLTAGPIMIGAARDAAPEGTQTPGWPEDRIDVSALGLLDADVAFSAPSLDLGVLKLGETRGRVTLERSRAVFEIRQMVAYGGQVTGDFVVNGRGGLSVGGRLSLAGMQTQPLLSDLAGWDRLIATGDVQLQFLGVGNSVAEIMAGLKGEGALELGKGELRGLDIAGMLRTLDVGYVGEGQRTIFDALAGTFTIEGGVLSNSDLKLVAPYLTASGAGKIGLGARELDYRIRPTALAAEDGTGGVMVPLLITGPWSDPSYRLDLESIARERMEAEAKAAEERARAELEARLQQELGVEIAPGESAADAAIRRAQEALEDEARRALEEILNGN